MLSPEEHLHAINNGNEKEFFDSIFGYLLKRQPYIFKESDGKSRLISYYEKWQHEYMNRKSSKIKPMVCEQRTDDVSYNDDSVKPNSNDNEVFAKSSYRAPGANSKHTSTISISNKDMDIQDNRRAVTTSSKSVKRSLSPPRNFDMDVSCGATYDNYLWNQCFEDLEVRIPVGAHISKGNQVMVKIERNYLSVQLQVSPDSSSISNELIIEGELLYPIKMDQSTWSLCPKDHIAITLEKLTPMWWDQLILSEPKINLKNLSLERDYHSLPDDEKAKISKIIFEKEQRDGGVEMTDNSRASAILREAWDKDGSPFRGQPFDPSVMHMAQD